jgi:uncharacterized phage protein (TIGR01671 family)
MREIKFRGLSGEVWVYGSLIQGVYDGTPFFQIENPDNNEFRQWIVKEKSVGQFTGLKDKNGVEIYEGDILVYGRTCFNEEVLQIGNFPLIVGYTEDARFEVTHPKTKRGIPDLRKDMMWQFEIIGNIHQNPELL